VTAPQKGKSKRRASPRRRRERNYKGDGTVTERADGRWEAAITIGKTEKGNPKRLRKYFDTEDEANTWRINTLSELRKGQLATSTATVAELMEQWLAVKERQLKPSTFRNYQSVVRAYIVPHLGDTKLSKLTPLHVERFQLALAAKKVTQTQGKDRKRVATDREVSPRVVEYAHTILKAALRQAVRWRLIAENPAEEVTRPDGAPRGRAVWTREQALHFLTVVRDHRLFGLYLLAITAGLRRGELLGLRWRDVNLDKAEVTVRHTVTFINGRRHEEETTKTGTDRVVAISGELVAALRERRAAYELEERHAKKWQGKDYVFGSYLGGSLYESSLRRIHEALIEEAGLPYVSMHALRRTYTSVALLAGVPVKAVSARLGHASVGITQDVYQALFPEQHRAAALSSDELLRPAGKTTKLEEEGYAVNMPSDDKKEPDAA
jgi:integrase